MSDSIYLQLLTFQKLTAKMTLSLAINPEMVVLGINPLIPENGGFLPEKVVINPYSPKG